MTGIMKSPYGSKTKPTPYDWPLFVILTVADRRASADSANLRDYEAVPNLEPHSGHAVCR